MACAKPLAPRYATRCRLASLPGYDHGVRGVCPARQPAPDSTYLALGLGPLPSRDSPPAARLRSQRPHRCHPWSDHEGTPNAQKLEVKHRSGDEKSAPRLLLSSYAEAEMTGSEVRRSPLSRCRPTRLSLSCSTDCLGDCRCGGSVVRSQLSSSFRQVQTARLRDGASEGLNREPIQIGVHLEPVGTRRGTNCRRRRLTR